ncbi:serine/threonine-protein kinase [Longispora albida]|uniref:serine/threonine-protein kinase n=1 Tax=Longispora albida TaxID=203523 RepID=UPI00039F74E7|nr:serine/threonine-protein kinase [Longispora albida]
MKPLADGDPRETGPYRLLAELGRGGMGRVLLGHGPDGRLVAVKLIRPQYAEDAEFLARFRNEVAASRRVSGAYTAAVIDADTSGEAPWLASVFVPGPSLLEAVRDGGVLPVPAVLRLAAGLATALSEIHRSGIVHRDVKPSNVLLSPDGPRLIDFGIARALDAEGGSELTHTGWLIGAPGFMSPEQASSGKITPASDVFSLGVVLVMACTGRSPFAGAGTPQTLYNVVHAEPDLSGVPAGLLPIIRPCLAKDPAKRPSLHLLLARIGPLPVTTRLWPGPVIQMTADQDAELVRLLNPDGDHTTIIDRGPTLRIRPAGTKKERTPFPPSSPPADPPRAHEPPRSAEAPFVPGPPAAPPPRPAKSRSGGLAAAVILVLVLVAGGGVPAVAGLLGKVWDQITAEPTPAPEPRETKQSPRVTTVPRAPEVKSTPRREEPTPAPTPARTTTTKPYDGAYTAAAGDCFEDKYSTGDTSELHRGTCTPGSFKVLKRVDGSSDASGQCRNVTGTNWRLGWEASGSRQAMVLCLQYLYRDNLFNAQAGHCAMGNADGSSWRIVQCADHTFQVLQLIQGTSDSNRCQEDVRVRYRLAHTEARPDLSVVVCMTYRYGDDAAYGRPRNCMLRVGSGDAMRLTFADCSRANVYVSGYNAGAYQQGFCGNDGYRGYNTTGQWARYLNFITCFRATQN